MVGAEQLFEFVKRELDGLTRFIQAVDKRADGLQEQMAKCREHCDHCREVCAIRICEAKKNAWYRNWHFWHSLAAWAAIGYAVYLKTGGVIH